MTEDYLIFTVKEHSYAGNNFWRPGETGLYGTVYELWTTDIVGCW